MTMDKYNDIEDVEVLVTECLTKATRIATHEAEQVEDWDYDATTGRMSKTGESVYEHLKDDFSEQQRSAYKCLEDCCKVLKELVKEKRTFYALIYIPTLLNDCQYWEQEKLEVEEK